MLKFSNFHTCPFFDLMSELLRHGKNQRMEYVHLADRIISIKIHSNWRYNEVPIVW